MSIKVTVKTANEAYVFNDAVQAKGLSVDGDYSWRYTPAVNSWLGDVEVPATVEFEFADPRWATYFQLRWSV